MQLYTISILQEALFYLLSIFMNSVLKLVFKIGKCIQNYVHAYLWMTSDILGHEDSSTIPVQSSNKKCLSALCRAIR